MANTKEQLDLEQLDNQFSVEVSKLTAELSNLKEFNVIEQTKEEIKIKELEDQISQLTGELKVIKVKRQDSLLAHISQIFEEKSNEREDLIMKKMKQVDVQNGNYKETINLINDLIGIKQMFLNTRKQNITNLRRVCDTLEKYNNRSSQVEDLSKVIAAVGKIVEN
jgi:transcription elongation factor GreA-like protein